MLSWILECPTGDVENDCPNIIIASRDLACRNAGIGCIAWYVVDYHATCAHDGVLANRDAWQNRYIATNPSIIAN